MNNLTEKIKKDVFYMEHTHVNDPKTIQLLDTIEELLLEDKEQTIKTINELDLLSIEWICTCFEKISYEFQSKDFVECVERLLIKFPDNTGFKKEVKEARAAYYPN